MKRRTIIPFLVILFLTTGGWIHRAPAQGFPSSQRPDSADYPYWIRMMQDPGENFFKTVSAFNRYWKDRPVTKGCGWKVFKRWEYIQSGRIAPGGQQPSPDAALTAWNEFTDGSSSASGTWTSLGPSQIPSPGPAGYLGLGRLNVVAFHPTDANRIYAGSPSGGFWLTTNHGATWTTTTDQMPTIGVSAIAVDYSNPSVILIGTGDRDAGDAPGLGVLRSTDGGTTWTPWRNGMPDVTVGKIIQHPGNPLIFLAATSGGIYRTINGGALWTLSARGDFKDICFKPANPSVVYATKDSDFYRSSDNGLTFTQITSGLTTGQRGAIAVTAANPEYVYFLQSNNNSGFKGVYRSVDGGLNFSTRSETPNILDWSCDGSDTGGQGWYDLSIAADPANAEVIYVGGVDIWKSVNGGSAWAITAHWYGGCGVAEVHADIHFLGYSPANGRLYAGSDGGICYTANAGASWTDCTVGMTIGQIYKIGQSQTDATKTINGFQDNGTYTLTSTGWVATGGGDGMECAVDYTNASYTYHTLYFGSIFRKYNNGSELQIAGEGVFGINESGAWVTPFILSENDPKKMFVGYKNVWRSPDVRTGNPVWTKISDGEFTECSVLEQSPANVDLLYVVRWGEMKKTLNANATTPGWTSCTLPGGYTPTDLEAHPTQTNTVYATAGNKVWKSTDAGNTWSLVQGTLPDVTVNCIVYDKNSTEGLYIGTRTGVLYKDAGMQAWINFSSGLPVVDVRELEIYYNVTPSNNRLFAATYGRGLWRSDLYAPPPQPPVAGFLVSNPGPCPGETVTFTDVSQNAPTSWLWSFSPSSVTYQNGTTSASRNPQVKFSTNADYTVTLTATNAYGPGLTDTVIGVGGGVLPYEADFENGAFPAGTVIQNPDNGLTWAVTPAAGNPDGGSKGVWMDFYDYSNSGQLDDMILQPVTLVSSPHPWLKFKVAYRRYDAAYYDGLKVFVSTNCGTSWQPNPIYNKSGSALATGPDQSGQFYPAVPSDWRTDSVDLSAWKGQKIRLNFQAVNGYGNNLYLDDITIADVPVVIVGTTTVVSGQNPCYDGIRTIRVADGSASFNVNSGGSVNFIAGQNILFFEGTRVYQGGYLHGRIAPAGPFCGTTMKEGETAPDVVSAVTAQAGQETFRIFPNPNDGKVTLDLTNFGDVSECLVEIFGLTGERKSVQGLKSGGQHLMDLSHLPTGIYVVRVTSEAGTAVVKMVRE